MRKPAYYWAAHALRRLRGSVRQLLGAAADRMGINSMHRRGSLGDDGERLAERYLKRQGLRVIARRVRIAGGEIDLIGVEDGTLVFVEVKTRKSTMAGHPLEAVTERKQQQVVRLAWAFLKRHRLLDRPVRFDVVGVLWPDGGEPTLTHVRHAFEESGRL